MAKQPNYEFTLDAYIKMVGAILCRGYQAVSYVEAHPHKKHLILRHDVDFDLDAAVAMAKCESQHGLKATYFILLRTEFYNVASAHASTAISELASLGHDIGLHFDASLYEGEKDTINDKVKQEASILSSLTGRSIGSMSLHRPHPTLLGQNLNIDPLVNSYAEKYFNEFGYCSDSNGGWHYDYPLDHKTLKSSRGMHLLTHPIWWTGPGNTSLEKLDLFLQKRADVLQDRLSENCKLFEKSRHR